MTLSLVSGPEASAIIQLAHASLKRLPAMFREHLSDVIIRVEEFADAEMLKAVGIASPWELSGLYQGHPVSEQSIWASGDLPPMVFLFRQPLLLECRETGVTIEDLVHHVVVHEIGHHFGLSDAEMEAIEKGNI